MQIHDERGRLVATTTQKGERTKVEFTPAFDPYWTSWKSPEAAMKYAEAVRKEAETRERYRV